jgi:predicted protein tyrosine phosphatase
VKRIIVSSVSCTAGLLHRFRPDAMLSIAAKPIIGDELRPTRHLSLSFADIDFPTPRNLSLAASASDIEAIRSLRDCDQVLIHCQKGQRWSPTAALILLHDASSRSPRQIAEWIVSEAPYVDFNRWMLKLAGIEASHIGAPRPFVQAPLGAHFILDLTKLPWGAALT